MKILILALLVCLAISDEYNEQFVTHELCVNGKSQSPVDLEKLAGQVVYKRDRQIYLDYHNWALEGVDEGAELSQKHSKPDETKATITIVDNAASKCQKVQYEAIQFHWHTPSEHTFDIRDDKNQVIGNRADLEFHLVHIMKDEYVQECTGHYRDLLVLGVSFSSHTSSTNRYSGDSFFQHMNLGDQELLPKKLALIGNYLPTWFTSQGAYHYKGSLTTPTCGESVEWYVAREVQKVEEKVVERMKSLLRNPSNRETQAFNDRVLFLLPKTQWKKGVPPPTKETTSSDL